MIDPSRILVACQGANREPFRTEMQYLFKTLNHFGGSLSLAQKIACFTEPVDSDLIQSLVGMGVRIKITEELGSKSPHSNKIQMLSLCEEEDFDYLVALDTDIVVAGDFSKFMRNDAIGAKPVDQDPLDLDTWKSLFAHYGLQLPQERYKTSFHFSDTIPYFNSGVILVPKKYVDVLYQKWKFFVAKLEEEYENLPTISQHTFFTDQFAFTLALASANIPHFALPLEMNFPTHSPIHENLNPEVMKPYLIHYHHNFSNGNIAHCSYDNINSILDGINLVLSSKDKTTKYQNTVNTRFYNNSFDNLEFWQNRYTQNPTLGSGIGSREIHLQYKRSLMEKIWNQYTPQSVLDVGCGDIEVVKELPFQNYTGVDLSPHVVSENKIKKPEWNFISGNFIEIAYGTNPKADLVMCFDVLIHQHDYKVYEEFVKCLINATNKVGMISSFEWFPRPQYRSEITAYHEPITVTLEKFGLKNVKLVGVYRDTCIIMFEKNSK